MAPTYRTASGASTPARWTSRGESPRLAAMRTLLLAALVALASPALAHPLDDDWLPGLMVGEGFDIARDPAQAAEHRVQILVSVVKEKDGRKVLERHGFRVDAEYFYPASAVKTCGAVAALQRFAELRKAGKQVGLDTPLTFHPVLPGERVFRLDASHVDGGKVTLGHLIRQMSIVSSNEAFNRLYELSGHEGLNRRMQAAGLSGTVFTHRLSRILSTDENRKTPRIDLAAKGGVVTLPEATSALALPAAAMPRVEVGDAYLEPGTGKRVEAPMSFAEKNRMSLVDLQNMLVMITRPDVDLGLPGFGLEEADRKFLVEAMRQRPGESTDPVYPEDKYNPRRFKPVLGGLLRVGPLERWTIYSKAGKAYGFRIENAYVVDTKTKKGFFLTVNVLANPNRVMNDGAYAYDQVADPFIHALGERLARTIFGD